MKGMTAEQARQTRAQIGWVAVVVIALITVAQTAWFSYEQRQEAACQTQINRQFLDVIKERSETNESDRENVAKMVEDIVKAKSGKETRKALDRYLTTKQQIDAKRERLPYPDVENRCGG